MKWVKLFNLLMQLKDSEQFRVAFINHEEALTNALKSRDVPLRGKLKYRFEFSRIESLLSEQSTIRIFGNSIDTYTPKHAIFGPPNFPTQSTFEDVEADADAAETWLLQNAIDSGRQIFNSIVPGTSRAAIEELKKHLSLRPDNPVEIKKDFFDNLKAGRVQGLGNRYGGLSWRQFCRIWTEAAPASWTRAGFRHGRPRKIKTPR